MDNLLASFQTMQLNENRLYSAAEVNNLLTLIAESIRQEYANDMNTINKYIKTGRCLYCNTLTFRNFTTESYDERCFISCEKCDIDICVKCFQKLGKFREIFYTLGWKMYENPLIIFCPKCSS